MRRQPTEPKSKTCFVISPIGKPDTDVRRLADDLYELVIVPALEMFGFTVVRADKIPRPGVITSEIVHLVQNAELCIIDLTGHNANVFYECGRRHETARPFIQVIRKGDELPFDVSGIRTIFYDVTTPRATKESIDEIRKYVEEFESAGYGPSSGGASLSSIALSIERLDRRIGQIIGSSGELNRSVVALDPLATMTKSPREQFMHHVANGNFQGAAALLPILRDRLGPDDSQYLAACGYVAATGHQAGADALLAAVTDTALKLDVESLKVSFGALVQYYVTTDQEQAGVESLSGPLRAAAKSSPMTDLDRAFFLNQLQKLLYGAGDYEAALKLCREVMGLAPDEPAYIFNASLVLEKTNQPKEALELVDEYIKLPELAGDHLSHAVQVYVAHGRIGDAQAAFQKLREVDPTMARLLLMDRDIVRAIQ